MVVFGITGGSGSGKTSVSKMLEKLGVHIIDTDVIAHEIVEPNSDCLNELVDYFGDSILNDDKTLNRKKLASIAFSDKQKTEALSNITHKFTKRFNITSDYHCSVYTNQFGISRVYVFYHFRLYIFMRYVA